MKLTPRKILAVWWILFLMSALTVVLAIMWVNSLISVLVASVKAML